MEKVIRMLDRISDFFGFTAGFMMLFGFSIVLIEIVLRALFTKTLYITSEYTAYMTVGITFLGLAYTLKEGGHIRLTFLHSFLKGKSVIFLDIITFIIGILFFSVVTYITAKFAIGSYVIGSRSMQITRTLLWIPQSLIPIGSSVMILQFTSEILKAVEDLKTGTWKKREIETRTVMDE
ncbi:MAG: TRAP transporter small permease [Clostridia bacterium]|nr:TRAP transporter small permease [Clostridia bacterium]